MPKKYKNGNSIEFQKEFPDNEACVKHPAEQPWQPELAWMKRSEYTVHAMTSFNEEYSVYK